MQTEQLDYSDVLSLCSPQLLTQEGAVQSTWDQVCDRLWSTGPHPPVFRGVSGAVTSSFDPL